MALFELSVGDEMGSSYWLFEHSSKTPEQFEDDCHKAICEVSNDVIKDKPFYVSVCDWLKAIVPVLESWGYKNVHPAKMGFHTESLKYIDETSKWRTVIGEKVYNKAVKAGCERWVAHHKDSSYFIIMTDEQLIYHHHDCPAFHENWYKEFYVFKKESFTRQEFRRYKPCPICFNTKGE